MNSIVGCHWTVRSDDARLRFATLADALNTEGEEINANWMSRLVRVEAGSAAYYVKSYASRGRGLRRWIGRSRLRAEWENLLLFRAMGIATADVEAYGEEKDENGYRGALVTREIKGTRDLADLAREESEFLLDREWRKAVIRRLSEAVRTMHERGFVHNDLKWRNILVELDREPGVYIIDCPMGRTMAGPFLARGRIKALACLDKVGKWSLSRTDRLRFYLAYRNRCRLDRSDKGEIRKVLGFFSGRE